MSWAAFERQVAELFELLDYDVTVDVRVQAAQTDLIAVSRRRFKPNLLVECKYHENIKNRVSIDEIENFAARVVRLRMDGKVDHGYLVTNTGFTSHAKGSIFDSAAEKFVFLCTYDELFSRLIDTTFYLKEYVRKYEESGAPARYVDLWALDQADLDGLKFDSRPGDVAVIDAPVSAGSSTRRTVAAIFLTVSPEVLLGTPRNAGPGPFRPPVSLVASHQSEPSERRRRHVRRGPASPRRSR